jgi:predicted  nucleic acid-binding Zn-ribbon protein
MATNLEKENLEAHVDLCAERYRRLEEKFETLSHRMDAIEERLEAMSAKNSVQFEELKKMMREGQESKFKVLVTTAGSVVAALLATLGYLIARK